MPTSTRRRRGGRQRNPPVDATQAPVPEPELPGRTGYVPAPLRLPDALTSTPSAAPRAPAARPAWMPRVRRTAAERAARLRLPACGAEQEIVDAVRGADVVVLSGATGSGKSTQVPQFLYEAGLCGPRGLRVVATQPRRVAVVATAERVARELGAADPGAARDALVAYRTRYDRGGLGPATRLVFETDGVLLRELERDLLLRDYGAAVVDEAHERSLTTDLLLGLLGRSVALRRAEFERARAAGEPDVLAPLKVVVMSATLDARALSRRELWPAPPRLVELEGRQHPVSVHFARETVLEDYAGAALEVVRRVHREAADDGAILVFLTGRREIEAFCGELRSDRTLDVRPLYAQMALEAQREAFAPTRAGRARKVVVATDVAETSLTIPGARPASGRRRLRPTARPQASSTSSTAAARSGRSSSTPRPAPSPTASAGSAARTPTSAAAARGARGRATATGSTARRSTRRRSRRRRSRSCCACRWSTSSSGSRRWACATRPPSPSRTAPPPRASRRPASRSRAWGPWNCAGRTRGRRSRNSAGRWRRSPSARATRRRSPTRAASPRVWRPPSGTRSPRWPSRASRPPPSGRRSATARPRASAGPSATRWATPTRGCSRWAPTPRPPTGPRAAPRGGWTKARWAARSRPRRPARGAASRRPVASAAQARLYESLRRSCVKAGVFAAVPALAALAPASAAADARLARCLAAGGLDRVARLAEPARVVEAARRDAASRGERWDPRSLDAYRRDCAYEPLGGGGFCYVHPASAAHARTRADLPEFVVYATVSSANGRRRLEGVTAVEGRHLARLGHGFVELGGPCASPEPTLAGGVVRAFRRAALTRRGEAWALPLARARVDRRAVDARTRRSRRSARRSTPSRRRTRRTSARAWRSRASGATTCWSRASGRCPWTGPRRRRGASRSAARCAASATEGSWGRCGAAARGRRSWRACGPRGARRPRSASTPPRNKCSKTPRVARRAPFPPARAVSCRGRDGRAAVTEGRLGSAQTNKINNTYKPRRKAPSAHYCVSSVLDF